MATLTVIAPTHTAGTDLAPASAAAAGDQFLNDGKTVIYVKNVNATTRTVTFVTNATLVGVAVSDVAVAVAQNEEKMVGPFPVYPFNDSSGYVQITYSSEVGVTIKPVRVG